jgi:metal-dependent HD superfamily phosphatase/phosphodiesterase
LRSAQKKVSYPVQAVDIDRLIWYCMTTGLSRPRFLCCEVIELSLSLADVQNNKSLSHLIARANDYLSTLGYTEHGTRHVTYVSRTTGRILRELGYDQRYVELGEIAGYLHDVGNMHNRKFHGPHGAILVYTELRRLGMPLEEICEITMAIANHEEEIGIAVTPLTAALIIADKSDAHRTRVRQKRPRPDIHDRVNLAITDSRVEVDSASNAITLDIDFDTSMCQIMDYFEIYLKRMEMCKQAATTLGCRFRLAINGLELLGGVSDDQEMPTEPGAVLRKTS